jgi:uncharacterized protein with HEPN domain
VRRDLDRLRDILEAIEAIERHTAGGRERFDQDELVRTWCLKHVEIIGEAVARLSEDLRSRYATVPWRAIIGMRNTLVHGYFDVDWDAVWAVVENDLGKLRSAVEAILETERE